MLQRSDINDDEPWRSDLRYGGMSDAAAEKSWRAAQARAEAEPIGAEQAPQLSATEFIVRDPATLPVRDVLYGNHLIRGFTSGLVGITGGGKSTLSLTESFAMVTGKPLLGVKVRAPLRCWNINLEDPRDEIERRAQAICLHYGLTDRDLGGRMFLDSGRDQPVVIARALAGGTRIIEPMVDRLIDEIIERQIDVLTIDPFVSSHEVPENDNNAIDMVIKKAWGAVAEKAKCAVQIVHHLRKIGNEEPSVDAARGAGALAAGLRAMRVLAGMTADEARKAGVDNPYRYFRVFSGKLNMAPRENKSDWYHLESVDLGNGKDGRPGDRVQVAGAWKWPEALDGMTGTDFDRIAAHIRAGRWRENSQATNWAGKAIAEALDLNLENAPDRARVVGALKAWIAAGSLIVVEGKDEKRETKKFVEVAEEV
jgi:hypothetical protein